MGPGCALQENLKMGKGQNEGGFSQEQLDMYKECFKLMDIDKDGTITKNDIRAAFDNVGKLMSEGELDDMLGEVGGACTFQAMIDMFQKKMAGGSNDPDDLIVRAFKAYETDGKIEAEMFRHSCCFGCQLFPWRLSSSGFSSSLLCSCHFCFPFRYSLNESSTSTELPM